ncbi:MAG: uL30 family ribosomal protein [Candidatus Nanoarchaeia archaeon]
MVLVRIKKVKKTKRDGSKTIGVILIRGFVGLSPDVKMTLKMLNLNRKNSCVIVKNTESVMGMLFKVKDYVTYGEVDEETVKKLKEKGDAKSFRLQPPRGGFERKGIKKSYSIGGALGYRGAEMKKLIGRML